jgi:hypothetical protein
LTHLGTKILYSQTRKQCQLKVLLGDYGLGISHLRVIFEPSVNHGMYPRQRDFMPKTWHTLLERPGSILLAFTSPAVVPDSNDIVW